MRLITYSETELKTERVFVSSGSLTPRVAAGRPGKAASDSRQLPRVVFGWLCIIGAPMIWEWICKQEEGNRRHCVHPYNKRREEENALENLIIKLRGVEEKFYSFTWLIKYNFKQINELFSMISQLVHSHFTKLQNIKSLLCKANFAIIRAYETLRKHIFMKLTPR